MLYFLPKSTRKTQKHIHSVPDFMLKLLRLQLDYYLQLFKGLFLSPGSWQSLAEENTRMHILIYSKSKTHPPIEKEKKKSSTPKKMENPRSFAFALLKKSEKNFLRFEKMKRN